MREINKPKLRFKGFLDEWENESFSQVFDYVTDYVANGSFEDIRKNVKKFNADNYAYLIRLQDYSNDWKGPWTYTDKNGYDYLKKSKLNPGDIVMSNVGNSLSTTFKVPELDKPMTLAPNTILMKSSKNNNSFLFQLMISKKVKNKIWSMSSTSAQPKINKTDFKKINVIIPKMEKEQRQIGLFFDKVDNLIDLKCKKISSLERLKRGYLQKTLADLNRNIPELRFKKFTNQWESLKAKEIFQNVSNKNNIDEKVLSVTQDKGLVYRDSLDKSITYDKDSLKNYKMVDPDDVVISLRSFQGGLEISNKSGIVSPAYTVMKFKNGNYNRENMNYWKTFLKSYYFIQLLKKVTYGVRDGRSISYKDFSSLCIRVPSVEEQREIGSYFDLIDKRINLQKDELEHLKRLKKGYLQNMLV